MTTLAFGMPGGIEWVIIGAIGLLLFGRRLPEVGRGLGRSIVEFRRGIKGLEDEIDEESSKDSKAKKKGVFPDVSQSGPTGTAPFQSGEQNAAAHSGDHA